MKLISGDDGILELNSHGHLRAALFKCYDRGKGRLCSESRAGAELVH